MRQRNNLAGRVSLSLSAPNPTKDSCLGCDSLLSRGRGERGRGVLRRLGAAPHKLSLCSYHRLLLGLMPVVFSSLFFFFL